MKKCLHIITGLENGGAEALLYRLISTSSGNEFEHFVISLTSMGFYGDELLSKKVRCIALNMPKGKIRLSTLWRLHKLIKSYNPTIVQCWMYHANFIGSLMKFFIPSLKVIWGVHNNDLNNSRNNKATIAVAKLSGLMSYFTVWKIIYCSDSAREFHERIGYSMTKGVVIENGTDLTLFDSNCNLRKMAREEWGVLDDEFVIGMVARWDKQKNHTALLEAFSRLLKKAKCKLVLCGQKINQENSELQKLIKSFGLSDNVVLVGETKEVNKIYNGIDVHILPSHGEAFGNVTIEAMACKTPCVMSDVGAGKKIIGKDGWVIKDVSASGIEEVLVEVELCFQNKEKWNRLREKCRKNVELNFSILKMNHGYFNAWKISNE